MTEAREPLFRAPWPPLLITALIIGLYALQRLTPAEVLDPLVFSPDRLARGEWFTMLSAMFLHGGWDHALVNAFMGLAVGTAVSRYLGLSARGVLGFFAFYFVTGIVGFLGFAIAHGFGFAPAVGASGAVSGLMGGAARLLPTGGRWLGRITDRPVIGMTIGLLIVNLLLAVFGAPGSGMPIAWEAHLAGFFTGLFTIGAFARLFRRENGVTD